MQKLFDAIPKVVTPLDGNGHVTDSVVFAAWNNCVGELINMRTTPVSFRSDRLLIAVEDATWQRHLTDLSPQMLVKLNRVLGQRSVRIINFVVDPVSVSASRPAVKEPLADTEHLLPDSINAAADGIANEDLRRAFLTAAANQLFRSETDK